MVWLLKQPFSCFGRFKIHARHNLGMVGAVHAVTARTLHAAHMATSRVVNRAIVLGRSSRLGLAEASCSEPLARALPLCLALPSWVPPWPRYAAVASALPTLLASRRCRCRCIVVVSTLIRCTSALLSALCVSPLPRARGRAAVAIPFKALRPRGPRRSDARTRCP